MSRGGANPSRPAGRLSEIDHPFFLFVVVLFVLSVRGAYILRSVGVGLDAEALGILLAVHDQHHAVRPGRDRPAGRAEAAARRLTRGAVAAAALGAGQVPGQAVQPRLAAAGQLAQQGAVDVVDADVDLLHPVAEGVVDLRPRRRVLAGEAAVGPAAARLRLPADHRVRLVQAGLLL